MIPDDPDPDPDSLIDAHRRARVSALGMLWFLTLVIALAIGYVAGTARHRPTDGTHGISIYTRHLWPPRHGY